MLLYPVHTLHAWLLCNPILLFKNRSKHGPRAMTKRQIFVLEYWRKRSRQDSLRTTSGEVNQNQCQSQILLFFLHSLLIYTKSFPLLVTLPRMRMTGCRETAFAGLSSILQKKKEKHDCLINERNSLNY